MKKQLLGELQKSPNPDMRPEYREALHALFARMEEWLRLENEHLRMKLGDGLRVFVDSLIEARRKYEPFRGLPEELEGVADIFCFGCLAALSAAEIRDFLVPEVRSEFMSEAAEYAGERMYTIIANWHADWVDRHGTEPPIREYDLIRDALKTDLNAEKVASGDYPLGVMLAAIDSFLCQQRDEADKKRTAGQKRTVLFQNRRGSASCATSSRVISRKGSQRSR